MIRSSKKSSRWFGSLQAFFRRWCGASAPMARKRPARYSPRLECLEDRFAPAFLTVNSLADTTAADSSLTLREAVLLVDGTLGRALTAGEQAQVTGTLGQNDTIQFNLPAGSQTITLTGGALNLTKSASIIGPGAGSLAINGGNLDRDFVIGQIWSPNLSQVVSLSGLTIMGGDQVYGGGLLNFGTLTVNNCVFSGNTSGASGGGGVYNVGTLNLTNTTFSGNTCGASSSGGGLDNISSGIVNATNCTFSNNSAPSGSQGGGVFSSGTITLTGCTFVANTAGSDGGGIYNDGTATVVQSSFTNNTTGADGGGIRTFGTMTMTACTVAGNTASSEGAASMPAPPRRSPSATPPSPTISQAPSPAASIAGSAPSPSSTTLSPATMSAASTAAASTSAPLAS